MMGWNEPGRALPRLGEVEARLARPVAAHVPRRARRGDDDDHPARASRGPEGRRRPDWASRPRTSSRRASGSARTRGSARTAFSSTPSTLGPQRLRAGARHRPSATRNADSFNRCGPLYNAPFDKAKGEVARFDGRRRRPHGPGALVERERVPRPRHAHVPLDAGAARRAVQGLTSSQRAGPGSGASRRLRSRRSRSRSELGWDLEPARGRASSASPTRFRSTPIPSISSSTTSPAGASARRRARGCSPCRRCPSRGCRPGAGACSERRARRSHPTSGASFRSSPRERSSPFTRATISSGGRQARRA